ncbi:hypothetical protein GGF32_008964 [Allomyces javanicus]|nr:hypothetical protein GGF32_008964 [Allomyces javanicus]
MRAAQTRRTAPVPPEHAVLALVNELARVEAKAAKLEAQLRRLHAERRKPDVKEQGSTTRNHARTTRESRTVSSPKDDSSNGKDLHATLRDALIQLKVYRKHVQLLQTERQQLLVQWPHLAANRPSSVATTTRAASPDTGPRSAPPLRDAGIDPMVDAYPPVPPDAAAAPARAHSPSPDPDPERLGYQDALALDTSWANREALLPGIGGAARAPGDMHTEVHGSPRPFTHPHTPAMHPSAPPAPPARAIPVAPTTVPAPATAADADLPAHGVSLITVPPGESLLAIDLTLPLAPTLAPAATGRHRRTTSAELPACEPTVAVIREFESARGMTRNVRRLLAHTRSGGGRSGTQPESPRTASASTSASVSLIDAGWPIVGAVDAAIDDGLDRRSLSTRRAPPGERRGVLAPAMPMGPTGIRMAETTMAAGPRTAHDGAPGTPSRPVLVDKSVATDVRAAAQVPRRESNRDRRHRPPRPASCDATPAVGMNVVDRAPATAPPPWDEDLDEITALLNGMPLDRHDWPSAPSEAGRATGAHRRRQSRGTNDARPPLLPGANDESLASLSALIDHLELADSGNIPSRM